jgi:hypothetical protein
MRRTHAHISAKDARGTMASLPAAGVTTTGQRTLHFTQGAIMKKQLAIVAAALATLTVGIARADDGQRPLTREEVVASVMAARQSGELAVLNAGGTWSPPAPTSTLTREKVVADVLAARESGELAVLNAGGTYTPPSAAAAPVAREKVISDFFSARQQASDALALEHSL